MAYRSDKEALRMRIGELEAELEDAQQTIHRLRGDGDASDTLGARLAGAPTTLLVEREVQGELEDGDYDEIVDMLSRRFPGGQVSLLGRRFNWSGGKHKKRRIEVTVTRRGGKSYLRVHEPLSPLVSNVFVGTASCGAGALTLALIAVKKGLALNPAWVVIPMVILLYIAARAIFQWRGKQRRGELTAIADDIATHIGRHSRRVRIDDESQHAQTSEAQAADEEAADEEAADEEAAAEEAAAEEAAAIDETEAKLRARGEGLI